MNRKRRGEKGEKESQRASKSIRKSKRDAEIDMPSRKAR